MIEYPQSLYNALKVPRPDEMPPDMRYRVIYAPSFHAEAMIETTLLPQGWRIALTTLRTHFYQWEYYGKLSRRWNPYLAMLIKRPEWRRAWNTVDAVAIEQVLGMELSTVLPENNPRESIVLDGMRTYVWGRRNDSTLVDYRTYVIESHNPVVYNLGKKLVHLTTDLLPDDESQQVLNDIARYF